MIDQNIESEIQARISTIISLLGEAGSTTESLLEFLEEHIVAVSIQQQAGINCIHKQVGNRLAMLNILEHRLTKLGLFGRILN
jgi:hypothetical protein